MADLDGLKEEDLVRDGPVPVYKQISDWLADKISSGDLQPGDPVPSEAQLARHYKIARSTARRVAEDLRDQDLVYTRQGQGTFVGPPDTIHKRRKLTKYQQIAEAIIERIVTGKIQPGRPIPSEKMLIQEFGVAKATARQAVEQLAAEGWTNTVPQRGTFVLGPDGWPRPPAPGAIIQPDSGKRSAADDTDPTDADPADTAPANPADADPITGEPAEATSAASNAEEVDPGKNNKEG
ncbi:regulatory protein, gntR family [Sinosporangium album]|uniref:Regulatory protein, gntR family n=1 Tax=Sinosporangium album TaxID=504805 RepID=A0A1G7RWQ7_9ACTN|nr:GntR family transcriptional regulator [Sinosporangium album]SDG15205.1 regulatory protein, gntR family [Sinosporangium album]